ncbi:MAG TPA: winged helix-turn-helix domain-containing protein [Actinomycetota bacterium]|nr:winged helix-turn-helix domain-containing protein [Actinomycetota bacterium]
MNTASAPPLPIFRSRRQFEILSHLLIGAGRSFTIPQLVDLTGASQPTVWREVERLRQAGILTGVRVGRTHLVRADESSPYFYELQSLATKLMGPAILLRDRLDQVEGVDAAFVFGSWAARYLGKPGPAPADVDVVVIGDADPDAVDEALEPLQQRIGVVNALVVAPAEWESARSGFLRQIKKGPLVPVLPATA